MSSGDVLAELKVILGADTSDYEKKMGKTWDAAEKSLNKFKDFGESMSLYVTAPILAAATAVTVWAAEEETADARLASSLRNVGVSYDKVTGQVHDYITALEAQTGIEDTTLEKSYVDLINITGSARTSLDALSVATDIASGTGRDLETVSEALGRALNGNDTALKRMGISLQANMSPLEILTKLHNSFKDTATSVAETVEGKWNKMKNATQNVAETIGHALEPLTKQMEDWALKLLGYGQEAAAMFAQQSTAVKTFSVTLIGLTAAAGPVIIAVAKIGTVLLNFAGAIQKVGGISGVITLITGIGTAVWAAIAPFVILAAEIALVTATFLFFYANGQKIANGLGSIFFTLTQIFSDWASGWLNDLAYLTSAIPGFGDKVSKVFTDAAANVKSFSDMSGVAAQELANDYESAGGYMQNTTSLLGSMWSGFTDLVGLNTTAINTSVKSLVPPLDGLGPALDQNKKKWADWAAGLKVTVQDLATGIYQAMAGAVTGITDVLTTGSGDWKGVLLQFLKASLAATTAWAIAKMTIFQQMSEALAAAISGPWGWLIIGGLIAATIAVGQSSIPAMATGGMTNGPTTALIGDNPGGNEVVLPMNSPRTTAALASAMPDRGVGEQTIIFQIGDEQIAQSAVRGMPGIIRISGASYGA